MSVEMTGVFYLSHQPLLQLWNLRMAPEFLGSISATLSCVVHVPPREGYSLTLGFHVT